jgi:ABC-type lipoprotein export system ATPase subunit
VIVKGESITELSSDERSVFRNKEIGFVYQFHHLLSELSTLENIALPAMLSGKSKDEALSKAQTLLSQVNLVGKEKNNPNQLSGGERQRVAIARSMSNDPSFLVMDEPTGNLDSQNVQSFMDLLMNMISEKDITLIIATHDQNVSSRLNKLLSLE